MKNRILALLLAAVMLCMLLPGAVLSLSAADDGLRDGASSGSCGDDLRWSFSAETGTLTITGSGDMEHYGWMGAPWYPFASQISSVSLPEGLTRLGRGAFEGLDHLTRIQLPVSLKEIGDAAFRGCTALTEIVIPPSTVKLGVSAFRDCTSLASVVLPEALEEIEAFVFLGCEALRDVTIPPSVGYIGEGAFEGCAALERLEIPASVIQIGPSAFGGCENLREIILNEGLKEICSCAFNNCHSLASVSLPATMTLIGMDAFEFCTALKTVKFSNGIRSIDRGAFRGCAALRRVELPESVEVIGYGAFMNCDALKQLIIRNPNCGVEVAVPGSSSTDTGEDLHWSSESRGPSDTDEDLSVYVETDAPYTLGSAEKTVIYCKHLDGMEDSGISYSNRSGRRCPESYAKAFGYSFFPINAFSDVKDKSYYQIPVAWAVGYGITSGTGDGQFSPAKSCTREQIVTFLYSAKGKPAFTLNASPFTDVKPGKYYYKPVLWAVENKITGGVSDTLFGVGKSCTREQVVTFLWKAAGAPEPVATDCPFTDVNPKKYYYKAVLWAMENKVTGGSSATQFGVGKSCTRAQVVTFLYAADNIE